MGRDPNLGKGDDSGTATKVWLFIFLGLGILGVATGFLDDSAMSSAQGFICGVPALVLFGALLLGSYRSAHPASAIESERSELSDDKAHAGRGEEPSRETAVPCVIGILVLFFAVNGVDDYSYYRLTRWAVCGIALYVAARVKRSGMDYWLVPVMIVIAVVFNPFIPVTMDRKYWIAIDMLAICFFAVEAILGSSFGRGPFQPPRRY